MSSYDIAYIRHRKRSLTDKGINGVMMKDKKEVAKSIFKELMRGDIGSAASFISIKLKEEPVSFVRSVGKELSEMFLKGNVEYEKLHSLWNHSLSDEKDRFAIAKNFEVRSLLITTLSEISKEDYKEVKEFVIKILPTLNDWTTVDSLGWHVITAFAIQNQKDAFSLMDDLYKSENNWTRRVSVVPFPSYIRAKPKDAKLCLGFLDKTMKEEDKEVKRGITWSLREISKKDSKPVFEFLQKWAKVDNKNTKWIIKDGMKKLSKCEQEKIKSLIGE